MSCYIYGDYFELFQPGQLTKMISGHTDFGLASQDVFLAFAILLPLLELMTLLSLVLPRSCLGVRWPGERKQNGANFLAAEHEVLDRRIRAVAATLGMARTILRQVSV